MIRRLAFYLVLALMALIGGGLFVPGETRAAPALDAPLLTLTPATALPNQTIAVTGTGFSTGGGVTVSSIMVGGAALSSGKISSGSTVELDSGGNFVASITIPMNSSTLGATSVAIAVTDSKAVSASATLDIPALSITVSPTSSQIGTTLTVTGANFPIDNPQPGADIPRSITIEYEVNPGSPRRNARVIADTIGGFVTTIEVPLQTLIPSTDNIVRAIILGTSAQAEAIHSVPEPSISISPSSGLPNTRATVTGSNFRAFAPVGNLTVGSLGSSDFIDLYTDANGGFSTTFTLPLMDPGAHPVSVKVGGSSYIITFTMTHTSAPRPVPPPAFDLAPTLKPIEGDLIRVFHFDNLTKGWSFYDPRPAFAQANTLNLLIDGEAYWIEVRGDYEGLLGATRRVLTKGWNLIPW